VIPTTHAFPANVREALADETLRAALSKVREGFGGARRQAAVDRLPEFDALRDAARDIKDHVLAHLDLYLERFEAAVVAAGGAVHWCDTPAAARDTVLRLCREVDARTVTKGKTMVAEEIGLNPFLEANGIVPVETDLGEYIIQLAGEPPSHIIAPAIHKTKDQVADLFHEHHRQYGRTERLDDPRDLVDEARQVLRRRYLEADIGITGANFLIAETGSTVIVTNEGNGDLTQTLPKRHIVLATPEKVVPTLEDASTLLRVLARSATGQEFSVYTTFSTGPRRPGDGDGPAAFHVVIVDNGRTGLIGTEFQDMLRCIKCGTCLFHCPVYGSVGGHAYGWVYQGPMGAVLTPNLIGLEEARHLPSASSLCGRCEAVCPVRIPLPKMLRRLREMTHARRIGPPGERLALALWSRLARAPWLYRLVGRFAVAVLRTLARGSGRIERLPLAGAWTAARDFPAPEGGTFLGRWRAGER
jgi:L-lactate dehydrogenase complex protein LldF